MKAAIDIDLSEFYVEDTILADLVKAVLKDEIVRAVKTGLREDKEFQRAVKTIRGRAIAGTLKALGG